MLLDIWHFNNLKNLCVAKFDEMRRFCFKTFLKSKFFSQSYKIYAQQK